MSPESLLFVISILLGLAVAILVGLAAQFLVWRQLRRREQARMQKVLVDAMKEPAQKAAA